MLGVELALLQLHDFRLLQHSIENEGFLDEVLAHRCEWPVVNFTVTIAIGQAEESVDLERSQVYLLASREGELAVMDRNLARIILVETQEFFQNSSFKLAHVVLHHFTDSYFVSHTVENFWEVGELDLIFLLETNQEVLLLRR